MANEFVDADVRNAVGFVPVTSIGMRFSDQEAEKFDRWLARHDAQVKADALQDVQQMVAGEEWVDEARYRTRDLVSVSSLIEELDEEIRQTMSEPESDRVEKEARRG